MSAPKRVTITGPRRDVHRRRPRPITDEIDNQTRVGKIYLRSLIRTQLLLGLATVAMVVVPLVAMPLVFGAFPSVRALRIGPMPLWWVLLGVVVYPAMLGVGWWYVRAADRNEAQFTDLVERR
mgnify:FL=1